MEVSLNKNSDISELSVRLDKSDLENYVKKAQTELTRDLKVDGFRKGKVPHELAKKQLDEDYVRQAALDIAVQDSLARAIKEKELEVLMASDLKVTENSKDKLVYTVKLQLFPQVLLGDISKVKILTKPVSVTSKEVDDAIEVVRASRAQLKDHNGLAKEGDRIEVDFDVTLNGMPVEGGSSRNHPLIIGSKRFIPGFEDNLIGLNNGQEKEFSLTAPEDYFSKEIAGKKIDFKVKVIDIKDVVKPELDDNFARSLGHFTSLADLKTNVEKGLIEEKKFKEDERMRLEMLSQIDKESRIDVPEHMVNDRLDEMLNSFDQDLHRKGMEMSLYLAHINKTQDDMKKEWRPQAERNVRYALIIKKVAKDKNITATEEEIDDAVQKRVEGLLLNEQTNKDQIDVAKLKDLVAQELVNAKTLDYIYKVCSG